jgi:hypothetical protein
MVMVAHGASLAAEEALICHTFVMGLRLLSDEAILLEVADLQERDRVVSFLTREHGRKRGAARGARQRYSRFAGQLQPLARVHVTWLERPDRDLVRVRGVELLRSPHRLQGDLEGILLGCYLAEHAGAFAPEDEPNSDFPRRFWADQGCVLQQPYDLEVGAGTMHPDTFLRVLGPEPWRVAYVQPSRGRPTAATARTPSGWASTTSSR